MKRLFSLVLGGALVIGAATLGLPTGSANAAKKHDKNYWRHHRHHRHHRHRRDKLSY